MLNNPVGFLRNFRIIHHGADKVYNITIHPFNDRNGMMSRLLTMPILYRSGFYIGKYILEKSKDLYYDALGASQNGCAEFARSDKLILSKHRNIEGF